MTNKARICAAAFAGLLIASIGIPRALADPADEAAFFGSLTEAGVPFQASGGDQKALQLGYLICAGYTSGKLPDDRLVNLLYDQNWTVFQKNAFVSAAKAALCR